MKHDLHSEADFCKRISEAAAAVYYSGASDFYEVVSVDAIKNALQWFISEEFISETKVKVSLLLRQETHGHLESEILEVSCKHRESIQIGSFSSRDPQLSQENSNQKLPSCSRATRSIKALEHTQEYNPNQKFLKITNPDLNRKRIGNRKILTDKISPIGEIQEQGINTKKTQGEGQK
jgi:hypothetical protein